MTITKLSFCSELVASFQKTIRGVVRSMSGGGAKRYDFKHGTGAQQCNQVWEDNDGQIAASGTANIDLSSATTTDDYGDPVAFTALKYVRIQNTSSNLGTTLRIGGGTNAWAGPLGATNTYDLKPGEVQWIDLTAAGWAVTAGTADILRIQNLDGVNAAKYAVHLAGNV
jgi:hypothetical protein